MAGLRKIISGDVVEAAAELVGCVLARRLPSGRILRAAIVETEAYHMREPGCHAYRGRTPRTDVMFGPPGRLYVYFTYGMWHCCNVVCEAEGTAAAVLLRAAAPLAGSKHDDAGAELRLSGPGLLCRGLQIDRKHNGCDVLDRRGDIWIYRPANHARPPLEWTTRIGFSFPDTFSWRCYWMGHPAVSPGRPGVVVKSKRQRELDKVQGE
jgi:DNA-3-methyladenine glycosylase